MNQAISFDMQVSDPKIDRPTLEFIPKRVVCSSPSSLQGKTYKGQINCEIIAPTYVLKTKGVGSMESHRFLNKDIDKVFDGKIVEHGGAVNTFETLFREGLIKPEECPDKSGEN